MFKTFSSLKRQYFLAYAIMGSLMPVMAVLLKQKGLSETQIGFALGASNVVLMLTPVVLTLLADSRCDARWIISIVFAISSAAAAGLYFVNSFWAALLCLCGQSLGYSAVLPLLDALNLGVEAKQKTQNAGQPQRAPQSSTRYHEIRVWGTIGFIVPGILLFVLVYRGGSLSWSLALSGIFALLGAVNALRLPCATPPATGRVGHLPTAEAGRALSRRPVLVFCIAIFLASMASAAFGAFFPLYLTDEAGVAPQWIAPITNVGVFLEVFFMLSFGWFLERLGFKKLVMAGMLCMALRLALLAIFPSAATAVATQAVHGMVVLAVMVAPVIYLNQQADSHYRHSIQGLYTVAVIGTSRMAGSFAAGYVAKASLLSVFAYASVLMTLAAAVLLFAFHDELAAQAAD
jgi:MFS transporter, PPP family, 3-phenylpropionic acid transporter